MTEQLRSEPDREESDPINVLYVGTDERTVQRLREQPAIAAEGISGQRAVEQRLGDGTGEPIDCIVVEETLPDGSGVETVELLRNRSDVPLVLFGDPDEETIDSLFSISGTEVVRRASDGACRVLARRIQRLVADRSEPETTVERTGTIFSELSTELLAPADRESVGKWLLRATRELLGRPIVACYLYDDDTGELRPETSTEAAATLAAEPARLIGESDALWDAFVSGETSRYTDVRASTDGETSIESALVLSLGRHGVLVVADREPDSFDDADVTLSRGLASIARLSMDGLDHEAELRAAETQLTEQTERIEQLERLIQLLRHTNQALIDASSREEIERVVCERLVSIDPYVFAWIGTTDAGTNTLAPRTWAGREEGYLDALTFSTDDRSMGQEPSVVTARDGESQLLGDVFTDPPLESWREAALSREYRSMVSVPLTYDGTDYGVLSVYADRNGVFDEIERAVLSELADTVSHAINVAESRKALVSDGIVELEFRIGPSDLAVVRAASQLDADLTVESVVPQADGNNRVFFTVRGTEADRALAVAREIPETKSVTLIASTDEGHTFEAVATEGGLMGTIVDHGGVPRRLTASGSDGRVVVDLPRSADVREFVETFKTRYGNAELVARRERDRSIRTRGGFLAAFEDRLTDRQREVLRTAYFAGFFESPRQQTGEEIGGLLGISQPTFNDHLRTGQRKLLELLYEPDSGGRLD